MVSIFKNIKNVRKTKRIIWYCCFTAIPILQFLIFYVYVNLNSFILAFQEYSFSDEGKYQALFAGVNNFKHVLNYLKENLYLLTNSLIYFIAVSCVVMFLSIIFGFYISKNFSGSKFFQIILFLPSLISQMALGLIFVYALDRTIPYIYQQLTGVSEIYSFLRPEYELGRILTIIYNVFMGFGVNVVLYTTAFSAIDISIIEASHIDGASTLQEFWHISIPSIYNTFVTLFITAFAAIFTNQMNIYTLFEVRATEEVANLGYFLFCSLTQSSHISNGVNFTFSQISALGLMITAVMLPITLGLRKLLYKLGPSSDN
jgi:ABC-type sugar transport system permease subunit